MKSPWPLEILPDANARVTVGRSGKHEVTVKHVAVSGSHFALYFQDGALAVEDLESRYGTFVNGARIQTSWLREGDVLKFAVSPSYLFKNGRLRLQEESAGMEVRLENVGLERGGKKLLEGLNLTIHPGSFVGVLGPSGAGKSLTVALLNSTWDPTWGAVYFDGDKPVIGNKEEYRARQGTVMQEDLVYPALTVEENLVLAGRLRMASLSEAALAKRVNETLEEVNMDAHRDKPVKVLSGGQKKRVSIAIELLMRPQFIILDEPTSGLDPGTASDLMDVLRGLARRGFTIVCITHTLDTMNFFDTLLVLGLKHPKGEPNKFATLAFYGVPDDLYPEYDVRNAADLFRKLENLKDTAGGPPSTEHHSPPEPHAEAHTDDSSGVRFLMGQLLSLKFKTADAAGFVNQFQVVLKRCWLTFFRDRSALLLNLIQPIILATLTVLAQYAAPASISIHFFLVVSALWMGMTLTVREIVNEKKLYARDRLVALDPLAFLTGKLVTALLLLAPVALLLYLSARIAIPIFLHEGPAMDSLRDASFINSILVLWLAGTGGALVGLTISTLSKTERMAVMILPIALLLQVLLSRVVFGHSAQWDSHPLLPVAKTSTAQTLDLPPRHSPFNPVKTLDDYLDSDDASWQGNLVLAGSFLMVTRPATALLDMPPSDRAPPGAITLEWIYLLALIATYLALTGVMFLLVEAKWIGELR